jgi:hypothetical protein
MARTIRHARGKLVKEKKPEENPGDFPSNHCISNELYVLLASVFSNSKSLFHLALISDLLD